MLPNTITIFPFLVSLRLMLHWGTAHYWSTTVHLDKCTSQTETETQVSQSPPVKNIVTQMQNVPITCEVYETFVVACVEEVKLTSISFSRKFGNVLLNHVVLYFGGNMMVSPVHTHLSCCRNQSWCTFECTICVAFCRPCVPEFLLHFTQRV